MFKILNLSVLFLKNLYVTLSHFFDYNSLIQKIVQFVGFLKTDYILQIYYVTMRIDVFLISKKKFLIS